jgi:Carboxypeptidase regulatory-like domain/Putative zinc-finger
LSRNLQPAIHPDADQLSVFVEGAATAREQEKMLAHLAECAECRKAVFLMQPHAEPQAAAITPEKRWAWRGWTWRWLVPVGVPAAALSCALIAVLIYIRPHGTPETPQQMASVRSPETERPGTTAAPSSNLKQGAPTANADRAASTNSEQIARSGGRQDSFAPSAPAKKVLRQESPIAGRSNLPALKSGQATSGVPSPTAGAAPSVVGGPVGSVQTTDSTLAQSTINPGVVPKLPLNGRNFTELQQLQPADTKGAASQNTLAREKELPALQIQGASGQAQTLAGISGRITDRSGASIAGVTVTVRDAAGKTRQTTTGADGSFHLTQLPAGQYGLTATATGFKTSNQSIELKPSEMAMLQPVLDVGSVSEVVEVEADATSIQTESANVSDQVAETRGARRGSAALSTRPILATVSQGKRVLSLDDAGNLFLSRDEGKKWKKIKPRWAGKAVRIESTTAASGKASANAKDEIGGASEGAVFQLTTDAGTTWGSKDGLHWHQQ